MESSSRSKPVPDTTASHLRPFSVDSSLIPNVDSSDELRELGVSVYAQEVFEKGVIEQVDKALAEQEALLRNKRLRRDVREVLDQIRAVQLELTQHSKVCQTLSSQLVLSPQQKEQLASAREQQSKKLSELKELQMKEKMLLKALEGGETGDSSKAGENSTATIIDLTSGLPISDHERLIQCGEMTPFGTTLSSVVSQFTTPKNSAVEEITVRNEYGQSDDVASQAKRLKDSSEEVASHIQQNDGDGDGDYIPSNSEYSHSGGGESDQSDYEPCAKRRHSSLERGKKRKRDRYQPRELSDDDLVDDGTPKRRLRRSTVGARCQDDGDEELYKQRLIRYEKKKKKCLQRNWQQLESIEIDTVNTNDSSSSESDMCVSLNCLNEEDMVLEGGLQVPGPIWSKLYK
jgi:hypothetical protein